MNKFLGKPPMDELREEKGREEANKRSVLISIFFSILSSVIFLLIGVNISPETANIPLPVLILLLPLICIFVYLLSLKLLRR